MHKPDIYRAASAKTPTQRYAGIAFVGALHIVIIWALVNGLAVRIAKVVVPHDLKVDVIRTEPQKPDKTPVPLKPTVTVPKTDTVPEPIIKIDNAAAPPATPAPPSPAQPQADTAASAITDTHTAPAYPPQARRLGEQGKVQLRLSIGPDGRVTAADVVKSSGFADLDQAAAAWVMAHWKYQPAIRGGVPVASTAMAAVTFNLQNAG
jgi:protein TonB